MLNRLLDQVAKAASPGKIQAAAPTAATAASADSSLPDPSGKARLSLLAMGVIAVALAIVANLLKWDHRAFLPSASKSADFGLFAGFYIAAQVIERLGELVAPLLPPWGFAKTADTAGTAGTAGAAGTTGATGTTGTAGTTVSGAAAAAHAKADRAALMLGVTFIAGVLLSFASGLYFLTAVGFQVSRTIDVAVTGLVLAGGTTALHNLITFAQSPSTSTTKSAT